MIVCVTGMHRSGTSMVARILNLLGVDLGEADRLLPSAEDNVAGFWENRDFLEINEEILAQLGGTWHQPPQFSANWQQNRVPEMLRERALKLIAGFEGRSIWGWKDPRTSLTFPFWKDLLPDMKIIHVLRHPLEVFDSLKKRDGFSYLKALDLWCDYNSSVLDGLPPEDRLVTAYDAWFSAAQNEIDRLIRWLGLQPDQGQIERARKSIDIQVRHHHAETDMSGKFNPDSNIYRIFKQLHDEATESSQLPESGSGGDSGALEGTGTVSADKDFELYISSKTGRRPRVCFLALEEHHSACAQIRLASPLRLLEKKGVIQHVELDIVSKRLSEIRVDQLRELDILIVQRNFASEVSYSQLVSALGEQRPYIIFEFDDALDRVEESHPGYEYFMKMTPNFYEYVIKSDAVTVSTEQLRHYYRNLNDNIFVLPNTINEKIWKRKKKQNSATRKRLRMLFAGTMTHGDDLKGIENTLRRVLSEFADSVELLLWGNLSEALLELDNVHKLNEFKPRYRDYAEILKNLDVDFAIIPLADNEFNRAKSHIKWLEYAACGIPGIYSDIPGYRQAIDDGHTGLIVKNEEQEWYTAIVRMIRDKSLRQSIAGQAWKKVWQEHTLSANIGIWKDLYLKLIRRREEQNMAVSVIIPVYNKVEFTRKCLQAIYKNTPLNDFEVIVVDNASTDGTDKFLKAQLRERPRLKVLKSHKNLGFAGANNLAAQYATGRWLVFLNNDTEVHPGWLRALRGIAEKDPQVGAVGGKLLYPDGTLQHAGVVIVDDRANGDPLLATHIYYQKQKDLPEANQARQYQALSAACLLVPRELFRGSGGFDTAFWNGYEDVDLCFRLAQQGYKLIYQPRCVVTHHESKSGPERWTRVRENIKLLHERWLGRITPDCVVEKDGRQIWSPACEERMRSGYAGPEQARGAAESPRPLVSIVMLTYNALKYTRKAVESILAHTKVPYELIFVDNASSDGTANYLRELAEGKPQVRVILNKENTGFAAGNNQGAKLASGQYLLILNNDILVADGWLESMLRAVQLHEDIGMVGPITNHISGLQRVVSVPYSDDRGFYDFAAQVRKINAGRITPRRRIAGFAMLLKKSLFDELGGFDEGFGTGNFEDDDFCLRLRQKGYAIMVDESTFIHHYGSRTFKANKIDYSASLQEKGQRFRERWPGVDYDELLEKKNPLEKQHPRLCEQAAGLLQQAEWPQALDLYQQVVAENPLHIEARFGRAMLERQMNQPLQAEQDLRTIVRLAPDNALAWNQLGLCFMDQEKFPAARQAFEQAIRLDVKLLDAQRNFGHVLIELEDYENAVRVFMQILKGHPDDRLTLQYMAQIYMAAGRTEEAQEFMHRAEAGADR